VASAAKKAAIYMREAGLNHVYQLEGGILKYFEKPAAPLPGRCFVFDEREALGTTCRLNSDLFSGPGAGNNRPWHLHIPLTELAGGDGFPLRSGSNRASPCMTARVTTTCLIRQPQGCRFSAGGSGRSGTDADAGGLPAVAPAKRWAGRPPLARLRTMFLPVPWVTCRRTHLAEAPTVQRLHRDMKQRAADGAMLTLDEILQLRDHGYPRNCPGVRHFQGADVFLSRPGISRLRP